MANIAVFWAICGSVQYNIFTHYCRRSFNTIWPCSKDVCKLPIVEDIRQQCSLYCADVIGQLARIPDLVAINMDLQSNLTSTRMDLMDEKEEVATILTWFEIVVPILLVLFLVSLTGNIILIILKYHPRCNTNLNRNHSTNVGEQTSLMTTIRVEDSDGSDTSRVSKTQSTHTDSAFGSETFPGTSSNNSLRSEEETNSGSGFPSSIIPTPGGEGPLLVSGRGPTNVQ